MLLQIAIFLHIFAAMFWIGGMLFLILVLVPFLKTIPDPAKKLEIYDIVGRRFSIWGWVAIGMLVITGFLILYIMHGLLPWSLFNLSTYTTSFGKILAFKLSFVSAVIMISALHDFWIGPAAINKPSLVPLARIIGRMNFVLAIIILALAVILRMSVV